MIEIEKIRLSNETTDLIQILCSEKSIGNVS